MLFYFDPLLVLKPLSPICLESKKDKGQEKLVEGGFASKPLGNSECGCSVGTVPEAFDFTAFSTQHCSP